MKKILAGARQYLRKIMKGQHQEANAIARRVRKMIAEVRASPHKFVYCTRKATPAKAK